MRIPLDYYRILGLPLAASDEQLRQAYSDRIVQLPRREYSQAAITSRKQLIEEAYVVLSDLKERKAYDQLYLAHAYGSDGDQDATVAVENRISKNKGLLEGHNLTLEISQEELVGALLILQELGEYELVLKLGRPYIVNKNGTPSVKPSNRPISEESNPPAVERPDIVLTVALACLELGREQWQQGHYENAAISLETGEEVLSREGVFLNVRDEILADLYRLRPYRILELLALPIEKTAERGQGLQLLQDVLDERGGIDGNRDDQSGLNIDDFLRFIQQLRNYLTVAEQHSLFEDQSQRSSSAVATYLAVYALIARGFAQHYPALINQAKQMLTRLSKRQDVHLEQSLCALLLGQTEVATRALELSQEYEALVFIRDNSQQSPDLLPGLCLYAEQWLQNEVFPHFRDLAGEQASLKDYFSNQQVQAYLEAMPWEAQTTDESIVINSQSLSSAQTTHPRRRSNATEVSPPSFPKSPTSSSARSPKAQTPATPHPNPERVNRGTNQNLNSSKVPTAPPQPSKQRRRKRSQVTTISGRALDNRHPAHRRRPFARTLDPRTRLVLIIVFGCLAGILVLWLIVTTTFGWLKNLFFSPPSLQNQQLFVELNQPQIPIPDRNSKPQLPIGPLTQEGAEEVIKTWLSTKAAALGANHEIDSLAQILVGSSLSQWRLIAQQEKADNRYRKYTHSVKVESLNTSVMDQNRATVLASVTEATEFYEIGRIKKSDQEKLRVKYDLVRIGDAWRIRDMFVISKISTKQS
ncbi:MAG: DUF4101 domain-containing protein [Stigonema ocellatum SAG 48.90 = DSM 106950]|nr:DUF4101 domain-containing protein [Stigonema ocellatum SAG 48.90 = DSM 106950]